jgi:hypothetical protein
MFKEPPIICAQERMDMVGCPEGHAPFNSHKAPTPSTLIRPCPINSHKAPCSLNLLKPHPLQLKRHSVFNFHETLFNSLNSHKALLHQL